MSYCYVLSCSFCGEKVEITKAQSDEEDAAKYLAHASSCSYVKENRAYVTLDIFGASKPARRPK